jgi:hypothetical protein
VVEVSSCAQTTLDSKIAIYGGADCSAPVIACSDDNCSLQTKVSFAATETRTLSTSACCWPGGASVLDEPRERRRPAVPAHARKAARGLAERISEEIRAVDFMRG